MDKNELYILYGNEPHKMAKEILAEIKIEEEIGRDELIGIKPNLVLARSSDSGATTDPELVSGVIEYLQEKGFKNIIILEGSWIGDRTTRAYQVCGYDKLAEKYGVPLIDLQQDSAKNIKVKELEIKVCEKALAVDYLINMPVLKGHCQTGITCALKNLKGCIPDSEKRRFHTLGLHKPIAYLNKALQQDLIIVDGILGDLDFEEGGNPVQMNRVIAGKDPVLVDSYAAEIMGHNIDDIPYIRFAQELKIGEMDLGKARIIELNKDKGAAIKRKSGKIKRLVQNVEEEMACSACFGNLVHALKRLEEQGRLNHINEKIFIGQGFQGKELTGIGIGVCTKGAHKFIKGCPPTASEIIKELLSIY